ncbi:eCIS core domain-containing protein [Flavitalea flava]
MPEKIAVPSPQQTTPAASVANATSLSDQLYQSQNEIPSPLLYFPIQRKLSVGAADDPMEREADALADKVIQQPFTTMVQRKCSDCEEKEKGTNLQSSSLVQRSEIPGNSLGTEGDSVSAPFANRVNSLNGNGDTLPPATRSFMENGFGADFSTVKIHTGQEAAQLSDSINAQAFTIGNDIYFNKDKFSPASVSGRHLLAHELTHTLQQSQQSFISHKAGDGEIRRQPRLIPQPPTQQQLNALCYTPGSAVSPTAAQPELHPTYERWLSSFTGLSTFSTNDTVPGQRARNSFSALGTRATRYGASSTPDPVTDPVATQHPPSSGEEFIDHPTNAWVQNCLPANLRVTAYQLPADCADIAVILRHVWLSAHHRTESYNGWTVGDNAGAANPSRALGLIQGVFSGNVSAMVQPYSDDHGHRLHDFNTISPMLHPGDILVWEHRKRLGTTPHFSFRRTGGHTQTINNIIRVNGQITAITVLQGNQPIFSDAARAILQSQHASSTDPDSGPGHRLRDLPGRRIESDTAISISNFPDPVTGQDVWGRPDGGDDYSVLVSAGPPAAAPRPSATARGGVRSITDWTRGISSATRSSLTGVLESLLQEARSAAEGGHAPADGDMTSLGQAFGGRLRTLDPGDPDRLMHDTGNALEILHTLRNDSNNVAAVTSPFNSFETAFNLAVVPSGTTPEEQRAFTGYSSVSQFFAPFASLVTALVRGLAATGNIRNAQATVTRSGLALWQAATARAQAATGADTDDRPLYWTRIQMITAIRQFSGHFRVTAVQRDQLISTLESSSRGQTTIDFSAAAAGQKKVLISGFDPFGLNGGAPSGGQTNMTIQDSNPSGAAVLALDGQQVNGTGNLSAYIQGVIFPVRFHDFDQGTIENLFTPFLNGTQPVSMIMTISQGGGTFDIENKAGRRRSADPFEDNAGIQGGGTSSRPIEPPGIAPGAEFLGTQLPHQVMSQVPNTRLHTTGASQLPNGQSVTGTGGGFLSNEIFYRVRLLQTNIGGTMKSLPVGHLHVPSEDVMSRDVIVARVKSIIAAALPAI